MLLTLEIQDIPNNIIVSGYQKREGKLYEACSNRVRASLRYRHVTFGNNCVILHTHAHIELYLHFMGPVGEHNEWLVVEVKVLLNISGRVVALHHHGSQQT